MSGDQHVVMSGDQHVVMSGDQHVVMSRGQHEVDNHTIGIGNNSFEKWNRPHLLEQH